MATTRLTPNASHAADPSAAPMKKSGMMYPPRHPQTRSLDAATNFTRAATRSSVPNARHVDRDLLRAGASPKVRCVRTGERETTEHEAADRGPPPARETAERLHATCATSNANASCHGGRDETRGRRPSARSEKSELATCGNCHTGANPTPRRTDVHDPTRRATATAGGNQGLVVLEPTTMEDLEREERRAERHAEEDGEPCGHPTDHEDRAHRRLRGPPRVANQPAVVPVVCTSGASGPIALPAPMPSSDTGTSERSARTSARCLPTWMLSTISSTSPGAPSSDDRARRSPRRRQPVRRDAPSCRSHPARAASPTTREHFDVRGADQIHPARRRLRPRPTNGTERVRKNAPPSTSASARPSLVARARGPDHTSRIHIVAGYILWPNQI